MGEIVRLQKYIAMSGVASRRAAEELITTGKVIVNDKKVINNVIIGAGAEVFEAYDQFKIKNPISRMYAENKFGVAFDGVDVTIVPDDCPGRRG